MNSYLLLNQIMSEGQGNIDNAQRKPLNNLLKKRMAQHSNSQELSQFQVNPEQLGIIFNNNNSKNKLKLLFTLGKKKV